MMSLQEYTHFYRLLEGYCWSLPSFVLDMRRNRPLFRSTMAAIQVEFRYIEVASNRHDTCIEQLLEAPVAAPFAKMIVRNLVGGFGSPVGEAVHGQKLPLNACPELVDDVIEIFI